MVKAAEANSVLTGHRDVRDPASGAAEGAANACLKGSAATVQDRHIGFVLSSFILRAMWGRDDMGIP